jgi:hypothetical protein
MGNGSQVLPISIVQHNYKIKAPDLSVNVLDVLLQFFCLVVRLNRCPDMFLILVA